MFVRCFRSRSDFFGARKASHCQGGEEPWGCSWGCKLWKWWELVPLSFSGVWSDSRAAWFADLGSLQFLQIWEEGVLTRGATEAESQRLEPSPTSSEYVKVARVLFGKCFVSQRAMHKSLFHRCQTKLPEKLNVQTCPDAIRVGLMRDLQSDWRPRNTMSTPRVVRCFNPGVRSIGGLFLAEAWQRWQQAEWLCWSWLAPVRMTLVLTIQCGYPDGRGWNFTWHPFQCADAVLGEGSDT